MRRNRRPSQGCGIGRLICRCYVLKGKISCLNYAFACMDYRHNVTKLSYDANAERERLDVAAHMLYNRVYGIMVVYLVVLNK